MLLPLLAACDSATVSTPPSPLHITSEIVEEGPVSEPILVSAVLQARRWQPMYFAQSGIAESIAVTEGESVTARKRLATLDTTAQRNQVAQARHQVTISALDVEQAIHELANTETVFKSGGASPEEVHDAQQQKIEADNRLIAAELDLDAQRIKLNQMQLFAPFDGVISEMNLQVGDQVMGSVSDPDAANNTRPPMVILQPGSFTLRTAVTEGQALSLTEGEAAGVWLMEDDTISLPGVIEWVAPAVDRDSRTVAVRVGVTVPEPHLDRVRDGSTVRVRFTGTHSNALTVSEQSLLYHRDRAYVFRLQDGTVEKIEIEQGTSRDGRVEIRAGLQAGDRIASSHTNTLADGIVVEATP
ncbi:MAG: RND family efflux transporter MFP subunit [Myxococcota bacterium]|jgi:RND family efflux transporter MFP subunit